jgi:hypothetical protein
MLKRLKPRTARTSALFGFFIWAIVLFIRTSPQAETELIDKILLLGVLAIVPLGLSLVAPQTKDEAPPLLYRLAVIAQPIGAVAVCVSFFLPQGLQAAVFASVWVIATGLIALYGLWRFWLSPSQPVSEVSISIGLIYVVVGSGWLVMSRWGVQLLGFGETIVLLTAVHFHFAGFAAPILTGLAGRRLVEPGHNARLLLAGAAVAVTIGTPLVAAGITVSPILALAGTLVISLGLALLALLVLVWIVPSVPSVPARLLLVLASVSSLSAMVLASLYAYSIFSKTLIIDIPHMAMSHGILNAFGFSLCGLLAWAIVRYE